MPHYTYIIKPPKAVNSSGEEIHVSVMRIVEAKNQARGLAHVVADTIEGRLATPADFMALAKADGEIEVAKED